MRGTTRFFALSLAVLLPGGVVADGAFRCGNKIIEVGMSVEEVRRHCGEPTSSRTEERAVHSGNRIVGKTEFHIWTYKPTTSSIPRILTFDQDRLVEID
ncbi:MAG: DUF2845 domain-containing protein [Gammaproteobacteria bacterium]